MSSANAEDDKEWIKLRVVGGQEELGRNEIHFRIKITNTLGKLKKSYAQKLVFPQSSLRFLYDGRRINDDETAEQLEMKMDDMIEVYFEHGGPGPHPPIPATAIPPKIPNETWSQSQIQGLLKCIICMEPCASPIYNCLDNGHLMCGFCYDKLKATSTICPLCKCKTLQPSPVAERQSRQNDMKGNCPFSGCSDTVLAAGLMAHAKNCEYREIQCTKARIGNSGTACNKMFPLEEFPRHAINVHKTGLRKNDKPILAAFNLDVPFKAGNEESEKYWGKMPNGFGQLLCEYDGKYFTINQAVGNSMFYWWITVFGGQKEADRYQYETELVWKHVDEQKAKNAAAVQTLPVLPFILYENYDKSCGNYAMAHAATATAYSEKITDDPSMRQLTVRIKISKTTSSEGTKRTADTTTASASKRSK